MTVTTAAPAQPDSILPNSLLPVGLGLGICGELLIGDLVATGPGLVLWLLLFGTAACWLAWNQKSPHLPAIAAWSLVTVAASLVLVFRELPIIILAMMAVMLVSAAMVMMALRGIALKSSMLSDHIASGICVPRQALSGAIPAITSVDFRDNVHSTRRLAMLRGLLIALPLLLVFGSLFSQADLRFNALAQDVLSIFSPELPEHIIIVLLFSWLATGMLAALYLEPAQLSTPSSPRFTLGTEETGIVMGTMTALFLTFVIMQTPYLFGGRETIVATQGMTLADYARRGFFELVVVSALTLCILLVMAKISRAPGLFRPLAASLLACIVLILASALQRLLLYTETFGLTIDRLTALTFMAWIAVCLALFGLIILRGRTQGFAMGMTCSAVVIAFCFALANPAAIVIRTNTGMSRDSGEQTDYHYFMQLGSHGVPTLLSNISEFRAEDQCLLSNNWLQALNDSGPWRNLVSGLDDWRTWNLGKFRAREALEANRTRLVGIRRQVCPFMAPDVGRINALEPRIFIAQ